MKRYAKFGYAAPIRFRVILEKPQGGAKMTPPPTRAKVKWLFLTISSAYFFEAAEVVWIYFLTVELMFKF